MFKSLLMSKIEFLIPERDIVSVTELLANSEIFHLIQQPARGVPSSSSKWHNQVTKFTAVERRVLSVMQELEIAEGPVPDIQPHIIDPDVAQRDTARLEREADEPVKTLATLRQRYDELQKYLSQLVYLKNLEVPLNELNGMHYIYAITGNIPTENIERLRNSLEHIPYTLVTLHHTQSMSTVVLFAQRSNTDRLIRAARSAYLNPIQPVQEYRGTPAEAIQAIQAGMDRVQKRITEYKLEVEHLHEARVQHLQLLLWRVRASRTLAEIIAGYDRFHKLFTIEGWIPAREFESLQKKIHLINENIEIETKPISKGENLPIPTVTDNPNIIKSFQFLISNYGQPGYNELNPTWVMALTFPLVFGIMFGDVGHGFILTAIGMLLASGLIRTMHKLKSMGTVIGVCGVASIGFGFLYGSIFGFEHVLTPLWIRPLENITGILLATVLVGAGLLTVGMIYNIINAGLKHRWGDILFGHNAISGLVFYWSLIGLAAQAFGRPVLPANLLVLLTVISGICLTFAEPLSNLLDNHHPLIEDALGTYVMQAFFELFEALIAMLSNTLSYVRMGAFAVAHGALSMVVFILADMVSPGHGIGYILTIILGNLFVIGFEGLIVTIQTLRLEYYEFFSKFFSGNGLAFEPLSLLTQSTTEQ